MNTVDESPGNITGVALVVEGALAAAAFALGWALGQSPLATVPLSAEAMPSHAAALGWGIAGTAPLVGMLLVVEVVPLESLKRLGQFVEERVLPLFARTPVWQLAVISVAAGIGEELLFRGVLQAGVAHGIGGPAGAVTGLVIASVAFGVAHWITRTYAVLATIVGAYLGWLFLATDNILAPIMAHALYDFVALMYLLKWKRLAPAALESSVPLAESEGEIDSPPGPGES
jgi:membrane protease YdiL (CAAX protease family)